MHNAMLIHDDIEDGSTQRRGGPTLHVRHGVPLAINAGDSLTLMSMQPLIDNRHSIGPRLAARILEETMTMARATAEGQAMELGWRRETSSSSTPLTISIWFCGKRVGSPRSTRREWGP